MSMLGWLKQKALDSFTETQKREMEGWIDKLSAMNSDEVASLLLVATHIRNQIETEWGTNLLDPIMAYSANPHIIMKLHGLIRGFQKSNQPTDAAGTMVWLCTLRAGSNASLRRLGRTLWRELKRGMPKVEQARLDYLMLTSKALDIDGYDSLPIGLEPEIV